MYLLDTNVVSELRKVRLGTADPGVARWAESVAVADLYLSAITVQELELGVLLAERKEPARGAVLRQWLDGQVVPSFDGRILSVDAAVARRSAGLHVPVPRPIADGLIAATALVHGMTLVTRDAGHFAPMGVPLVNPWQPPATSA